MAGELNRQSITIEANANDEGHLYGSVGATEIVAALNKAVNTALKDDKLLARLRDLGGLPMPMTPEEFGKLEADETDKWRKVVEFAGVSVE